MKDGNKQGNITQVNTLDLVIYQVSCSNATRCITANVLQTKVDVQCDKLATKLSRHCLRRSTFSSYRELFVESRQL